MTARFKLLLPAAWLALGSVAMAQNRIHIKAAPSGPEVSTASTTWSNIPGLRLSFYQHRSGPVSIGLSAEAWAPTQQRMGVRVLVNGHPASPGEVMLANMGSQYGRTFVFTAHLPDGLHEVHAQFRSALAGAVSLGDRTLWVASAPGVVQTVAAGGAASATGADFTDIPGLSAQLQLAEAGDVAITLTAHAESPDRVFVRALVDGRVATPSDALFTSDTYLRGTHSMSFMMGGVAPGPRTVKVQWKAESGSATLGERSLTVGVNQPSALAAGQGGIVSTSAPSGPMVSLAGGAWADLSNMWTQVKVPENGMVVATLNGEWAVTDHRVGLCAFVGGRRMAPSDIVLTRNDVRTGCHGYSFVATNVPGGTHRVQLKWYVDGGGTGYIGDRNLTVMTFPAACPDMTEPWNGLERCVRTNRLLTICYDPKREYISADKPAHPAPPIADIQRLMFGPGTSNLAHYYQVNSAGRFMVSNAAFFGWVHPAPAQQGWFFWDYNDPGDQDGNGWTTGHTWKWADALSRVDPFLNFAAYDDNRDGVLSPGELGVLIIIPQNGRFGTVRAPLARQHPSAQPLVLDGVRIPLIAEAYIGQPPQVGVVAHELAHLLANAGDMYTGGNPYRPGRYSLMDTDLSAGNHLDPLHKIRIGWSRPIEVRTSGVYRINTTENANEVFILHDPARGNREYFMVENRQPAGHYDHQLPDSGLGVWHVMEDRNVYGQLPAPPGMDPGEWATIGPDNWGRLALRMLRPQCVYNDWTSLWDGRDQATGYDLLSHAAGAGHTALKWADGSASGFSIRDISKSGAAMTAYIGVPGGAAWQLWNGAESVAVGADWKRYDWMGYFLGPYGLWIYHSELGWLCGTGESTADLWMWSPRLGWIWTSRWVYPYIYWLNGSAWLYYFTGSGDGSTACFYNTRTGAYEWR